MVALGNRQPLLLFCLGVDQASLDFSSAILQLSQRGHNKVKIIGSQPSVDSTNAYQAPVLATGVLETERGIGSATLWPMSPPSLASRTGCLPVLCPLLSIFYPATREFEHISPLPDTVQRLSSAPKIEFHLLVTPREPSGVSCPQISSSASRFSLP